MVKMKTSPYLILIFLKILVLTVVFGQLSPHHQQFVNRRNRLFSQRRKNLHSRPSGGRTRSLKFPSRIKSRARGNGPPRLPFGRSDLSESSRSFKSGARPGPRPRLPRPQGPKNGVNHLRNQGWGSRESSEVFFVKLEDGFFGCQVSSTHRANANARMAKYEGAKK